MRHTFFPSSDRKRKMKRFFFRCIIAPPLPPPPREFPAYRCDIFLPTSDLSINCTYGSLKMFPLWETAGSCCTIGNIIYKGGGGGLLNIILLTTFLSVSFCLLSLLFFSERVPSVFRLSTTAGFVADQLM